MTFRRASRAEWSRAENEHHERADALTAAWRARRLTGEKHAVDDFLFTYYPYKPSLLRRYHPGAGLALEGAGANERASYTWYVTEESGASIVDAAALLTARGATIGFIERLLGTTASRPAQFGCFGLHEWAMVYRAEPEKIRHQYLHLRLGAEETNAVVRA